MLLIAVGLALWAAVHFWKRLSPASRAGFGNPGKGVVALGAVLAIVLMVIGYRSTYGTIYWGRTAPMAGINNLLMVFSVYLFAASGAKTRITKWIRNPQLTAVMVWAVAHLLVNGDTPSFLLFGGLFVWALGEVIVLNRVAPPAPYRAVPVKKEITAVIATLVVFGLVAGVHGWLGYNPFG
tara:strand:+ start:1696 stop:2238 length:543 start_codon:yes stop_codon:yes gene_type:complete